MDDKYGVVYLVENLVTNKKYIGITSRENGFYGRYSVGKNKKGIERLLSHLEFSKNHNEYYNVHLYNSIKKYGVNSFIVNEDFDFAITKKELIEKEKYWIKQFKSNNPNYGYNLTSGGEGAYGWSKNKESITKFRLSKAHNDNVKLLKCVKERSEWDNPFFYIWKYKDRLNRDRKELLFHMLLGGKIKNCSQCGLIIKKYGNTLCERCIKLEQEESNEQNQNV